MACSNSGFDRKAVRLLPRTGSLLLVLFLSVSIPFLSACDSLLDAAGLQRKPAAETEAAVEPPVAPKPTHRAEASIAEIQEQLNELGYGAGPVDGVAGPRTRAAIRKFKSDNGLTTDSQVTPQFTAALQTAVERAGDPAGENAPGLPAKPVAIDEADEAAGTVVASTASQRPQWHDIYDVAQEPYYEAGDNYIYSTGRIETAVRIENGAVYWVVNDGSRYRAAPNFLLPPIVWENRLGEVESVLESDTPLKWPPATSKQVVFTARPAQPEASPRLHENWSGEWRCSSEPHRKMSVPAGEFEVAKITCDKTRRAQGEWRRRVWYYAPDVRHYIRYEETADETSPPAVSELIAIRPGRSNWTRSARSGFKWAIQKLLDGGKIGDSIEWNVAQSSIQFDIALTGEMRTANNIDCRRYMVVRKRPGSPRIFPALACRDSVSGRWKIPGLERGSIMPTEVLALR